MDSRLSWNAIDVIFESLTFDVDFDFDGLVETGSDVTWSTFLTDLQEPLTQFLEMISPGSSSIIVSFLDVFGVFADDGGSEIPDVPEIPETDVGAGAWLTDDDPSIYFSALDVSVSPPSGVQTGDDFGIETADNQAGTASDAGWTGIPPGTADVSNPWTDALSFLSDYDDGAIGFGFASSVVGMFAAALGDEPLVTAFLDAFGVDLDAFGGLV